MGVDCWAMPEISHHEEPWRPLRATAGRPVLDRAYKVAREEALFALLGDVTNNKGRFRAGWMPSQVIDGKTIPAFPYTPDEGDHDPITPIALPRGVPEDASPEWRAVVDYWRGERAEVVCTHLTIAEIIAADWDQPVYRHGILFEDDYIALDQKGIIPQRWIRRAGGDTRIVNEVEYAAGVRGEHETLIEARWKAGSLGEVSHGFASGLEAMEQMRPETSRVRIQLLFEA